MVTNGSVSLEIKAAPEEVYGLVTDVTRMGEWSPECHKCEWLDGAPATVGATFKGHNKNGLMRWSTTAKVLSAEPGREFKFATQSGGKDSTVWRYRFEPTPGGTLVTESYEAVFTPKMIALAERFLLRNRAQQIERGMHATLERLKSVAESAS
ncbi:MAG: SRPBCC family protein [Actinomycetota bacterium]